MALRGYWLLNALLCAVLFGNLVDGQSISFACDNVQPVYNVATNISGVILCSMAASSLPDYSYAGVSGNACPGYPWGDDFSWDSCLPTDNCELSWPTGDEPQQGNCNITIPSDGSYLGHFEIRVTYFFNGNGNGEYPYYERSVANFTIVSDFSFTCPAGQAYQTNDYCEECPKGKYSPEGQGCSVCPPGTVGDTVGATACTPCPAGYYGTGGSSACEPTSPGWYSPSGSYYAHPCPAGTFSDTYGATSCLPCANGTYSCTAATACAACSVGRISTAGASYCTACPPGTFAADAGSSECTPCPAGTYSPTLASSSGVSCVSCPVGKQLSGCNFSSYCCM